MCLATTRGTFHQDLSFRYSLINLREESEKIYNTEFVNIFNWILFIIIYLVYFSWPKWGYMAEIFNPQVNEESINKKEVLARFCHLTVNEYFFKVTINLVDFSRLVKVILSILLLLSNLASETILGSLSSSYSPCDMP